MINQYEVPACLADELPEIKEELKTVSPNLNIFKSIQCLANYTMRKAKEHDMKMVKKCFIVADNIYSKGNTIVKNAIENVYVYSFSRLLNMCARNEKKELQAIMPICLYTVYMQQVLKSGI